MKQLTTSTVPAHRNYEAIDMPCSWMRICLQVDCTTRWYLNRCFFPCFPLHPLSRATTPLHFRASRIIRSHFVRVLPKCTTHVRFHTRNEFQIKTDSREAGQGIWQLFGVPVSGMQYKRHKVYVTSAPSGSLIGLIALATHL